MDLLMAAANANNISLPLQSSLVACLPVSACLHTSNPLSSPSLVAIFSAKLLLGNDGGRHCHFVQWIASFQSFALSLSLSNVGYS